MVNRGESVRKCSWLISTFLRKKCGYSFKNIKIIANNTSEIPVPNKHVYPQLSQSTLNLLDPELFFLVLAHAVYKMRIMQEPNTIEL